MQTLPQPQWIDEPYEQFWKLWADHLDNKQCPITYLEQALAHIKKRHLRMSVRVLTIEALEEGESK